MYKFLIAAAALCVASASFANRQELYDKVTVLEEGQKCIPKYIISGYNYIYRTKYDENECYQMLTQDVDSKARSDAMEDTSSPYPYYFPLPSYMYTPVPYIPPYRGPR